MFDKKLKKLLYLLSDLKIWFEKSGFGPYSNETKQRTTDPGSGWSGRWWRWRSGSSNSGWPPTLTIDLKKWKNINTHPICIVIDHHFLTLHWLGNRIFLLWSQINVRSSIRLTGGRQIDFKDLDLQRPKRKIFSKKLNFLKFRKSTASTFTTNIFLKSKQTFIYTIDYDHRLRPFC